MDVLIPAALENQITDGERAVDQREDPDRGRQRSDHARRAPDLHERGVFVIPDILANAGGVTTSYFEWVQDRYGYFWELDEVNTRLEQKMARRSTTCCRRR